MSVKPFCDIYQISNLFLFVIIYSPAGISDSLFDCSFMFF